MSNSTDSQIRIDQVPLSSVREQFTTTSSRSSFLDDVNKLVSLDRQEIYGHPKDNFACIADFWATYLGIPITLRQVADMMILTKISRLKNCERHRDSVVDIAGYAACRDML